MLPDHARNKGALSAVATAIALSLSAGAFASSHGEAPFIKSRPKLDGSDFYAFNSYEPGRESYVTLIANYQPLQDAYGGPNFFTMNDRKRIYEIHVDNDGDADRGRDLPVRLRQLARQRRDTGSRYRSAISSVAGAAASNIGPLGNGEQQRTSSTSTRPTSSARSWAIDARSRRAWAVRPDSGLRLFTKPL